MDKKLFIMKTNQFLLFIFVIVALLFVACHKEWLDIKRDKKQVVPATLNDLEALINNTQIHNDRMPYLPELASGDFHLADSRVEGLNALLKGSYLWTADDNDGASIIDWDYRHEQIFYDNIALEGLQRLAPVADEDRANLIRGAALFYRAWASYLLAQQFCAPYNPIDAESNPGIPIKIDPDINIHVPRGTIAETYARIETDLKQALPLLPPLPHVATRPSKVATHALLARMYLLMERYSDALAQAESALEIQGVLVDYNDLSPQSPAPFSRFNAEVIFSSVMASTSQFRLPNFNLDDALYQTYEEGDLRRQLFFENSNGQYGFKGTYDGSNLFFCGLATDEVYLIQAECLARLGNTDRACEVLNTLLRTRYHSDSFKPYNIGEQSPLINLVLEERRKQLCFRGLRWSDIRRLSHQTEFSITLQREVSGNVYTLSPERPNYVWYLPDNEILLNPIPQNIRY